MRGDVLVHLIVQLGGEVERDAELLRNRPRLRRAIHRGVREAVIGRVVASAEMGRVSEAARQVGIGVRIAVGGRTCGVHLDILAQS